MSAFRLLSRRAGAHSGLYVANGVATVLVGFASVAILTRFLSPHEFGELAILLVTCSILSMAFSLVTLQGTLSWAYGTVGGEDDAGDVAGRVDENSSDPQRALTTGLITTAIVAGAGCLVVVAAAPVLGDWLLGSRDDGSLVVWAAVSAAGLSLWRLVTNAVRVERRPAAYLGGSLALHLLQLAGMVVFLAIHDTVERAVIGLAVGTLAGFGVACALARTSVRPAFSLSDAREIARRGRSLVPVVISINVIQLGDVILLSRFAPAADVGLYRVASRIGASVSYWTSAFHMGWGPLRRDPLHSAAERELSPPKVAAAMASYFVMSTVWALLALTVFADELVRIAAPSFADAAPLIPLTAAGFALHGLFVLVYRTQLFPAKRTWFIRLAVVAAVTFVALSLALAPGLEAYGVAVAVVGAWTVATIALWVVGRRSVAAIPYEYGRMAKTISVAVGLGGGAILLAGLGAAVEIPGDVAAVILYPLGLIGVNALHRDEFAFWRDAGVKSRGTLRIEDDVVHRVLVARESPRDVARQLGVDEGEVHRRVVSALRETAGAPEPSELDERIGAWLVDPGAHVERQRTAEALVRAGVDPLDLDRLSVAARRQRRARRRRR